VTGAVVCVSGAAVCGGVDPGAGARAAGDTGVTIGTAGAPGVDDAGAGAAAGVVDGAG